MSKTMNKSKASKKSVRTPAYEPNAQPRARRERTFADHVADMGLDGESFRDAALFGAMWGE